MTHRVVLSGGLDSTCALALTMSLFDDVEAVSFHYGQRHKIELEAAQTIARHYEIPHRIVDLEGLLAGSALLGETDVPEGHYAEDTMSQTVVSGRNLAFASAAVGASQPGDTIVFGVHAGDHPVYADCRPEFWDPLRQLVADAYDIQIETPFLRVDKATLLTIGVKHGAPVESTWSCYKGGAAHCGRCGTCVERAEAFALAGIDDPTVYEDADYWQEVTA